MEKYMELHKKAMQFHDESEKLNPANSKTPYSLFANGKLVCEIADVAQDEVNDTVAFSAPFLQSPAEICELRRNSDHQTIKIKLASFNVVGGNRVWTALALVGRQ
jgi:hypothetical protein